MKSAVETVNPTRVKMTVEVSYEELKPSLDAAYKTIGQQIQVPGFRRGKVPARIIDHRVGRGAVLQEAVNEALPTFYGRALDENKVRPLGQPEVDVTEVPAEEGQELRFTAEVDVRPQITLPDLSGIRVEVDPVAVSDEDVEERIAVLRQRFGTLKGVDRPVQEGDFVSLDLSATVAGQEVDAVTGVSYEVGSETMLEGLDEVLVGMSAGDTAEFSAPLAGGDHAGEQADCVVTVQSVKERELPELDDDFAQLASEFDTLEELRADIVKNLELEKRFGQGLEARDKVLDRLLELVDVPVPEKMVEAEVHSHLEGEDRLDDAEHRAEVEDSTRKGLRSQLLLDAIVEQEELTVEQAELVEYLVTSARQYGMDPNTFAQRIDQQGQIPAMIAEVARRKALAHVLERATVVDTNGATVDLDEILGGSDEDESVEDASDEDESVEDASDEDKGDGDASDEDKGDGDKGDEDEADSEAPEAVTEEARQPVVEESPEPTDVR